MATSTLPLEVELVEPGQKCPVDGCQGILEYVYGLGVPYFECTVHSSHLMLVELGIEADWIMRGLINPPSGYNVVRANSIYQRKYGGPPGSRAHMQVLYRQTN